jgi:uncharacterized membrane protein YsdA (DUF1294 family)
MILMAFGIVFFYDKTNQAIVCHPYVAWMVAVNATAFIAYGVDKVLAILKKLITPLPRIAEALLLLLTIGGGFFGAGIGMALWNHKISKEHWYFMLFVLLGLGIHAYLIYLLMNNRLDVTLLTDIMTPLTAVLKEFHLR